MKYLPGRGATSALLTAALSMRMFWGLSVDFPLALNTAWLCPLVGFVIALPLLFSVDQASKLAYQGAWQNLTIQLSPVIRKPLEGFLALLLLYDAAVVVRLTASSSNIIALGDVTVHLLIVPLGLVIAALLLLEPSAAGNSARIALRILPVFLLILLLVQLKSYRVAWLMPILGNGIGSIMIGGVYSAGCIALMFLIWLPSFPDRSRKGIVRAVLPACILVSILLLCFQMSFPVMPDTDFTQAARIELILSNGRMSLSPQFILNILWYGGQLYLLAAEVVGASVYLHAVFPKLHRHLFAAFEATIISMVAIFNPVWLQNSQKRTLLYFPVIGAVFSLLMLIELIRKRGKTACAEQD